MAKFIQNLLIYTCPAWLAFVFVYFLSAEKYIKFSDTEFTVGWAITTLAAGFILSNLPQESRWVKKVKDEKGVFGRMSLFLMSPTVYGLLHYILSQVKGCDLEFLILFFYLSTIISVLISVFLLGVFVYKVHLD